jgi:acyl dehydratase
MLRVTSVDELPRHVGAELGHTEWIRVDQDRVTAFAEATEDRQWIHVDVERAGSSPFGGPIAHGFLSLSLFSHFLSGLLAVDGAPMLVNYGMNRVRFPSPVLVGSRVRAAGTLADVEPVPGGYQLVLDVVVEVEDAPKPACVGSWLVRVT